MLFIHSPAFLLLYGIALAVEGWGVVASLKIYPPFAGAAVSAITLVVAFGFAVSRPCLTLKVCKNLHYSYNQFTTNSTIWKGGVLPLEIDILFPKYSSS